VVPAAGIGQRMQSQIPKQYLRLQGKTVLEHSLERLLRFEAVQGVVLALHPGDKYWGKLAFRSAKPVFTVTGGDTRSRSVYQALLRLQRELTAEDWVLVHDAARPCVTLADIHALWQQVTGHPAQPVGGILALPMSDTVKQGNDQQQIIATIPRQDLWRAQTPQLFRFGKLYQAVSEILAQGLQITDEASALEYSGAQLLLVAGRHDNIKITHPEDLALAEAILQWQSRLEKPAEKTL
jgi:2-C-methyl-D-erythritol 4-phosphate cytidylyltransferase